MTDLAQRLTKTERETKWDNTRPKDASTMIIIDRSGLEPKILMGKRNNALKFMAGKYVFPGGRIDNSDKSMVAYGTLSSRLLEALQLRVTRPSMSRARALVLTAIRETYEETGLLLGTKEAGAPKVKSPQWEGFETHGVFPNLESVQFIARAITPPKRPKRFDTRFFAVDASEIAHTIEGIVTPNAELVELQWLTFEQAKSEDLPTIQQVILEELKARIEAGFSPLLPVPMYQMIRKSFVRTEL
jgi:8-oxo-dGTP pyrophosphatase MutT (NUDIX family)